MASRINFVLWISRILNSARISILFNGLSYGFFKAPEVSDRVILSRPFLLGIAEDFLSRFIISLCDNGIFSPSFFARQNQIPTHLVYADDIILFGKASKRKLQNLKELFLFTKRIRVKWSVLINLTSSLARLFLLPL